MATKIICDECGKKATKKCFFQTQYFSIDGKLTQSADLCKECYPENDNFDSMNYKNIKIIIPQPYKSK